MSFRNPVPVYIGPNALRSLAGIIQSKKPLIVTSKGGVARGYLKLLRDYGVSPAAVYDAARSTPSLSNILEAREEYQDTSIDCIVAIGGGSVIDTAKALALRVSRDEFHAILTGDTALAPLSSIPVFTIPTIVGSGSEMTRWATIWDFENKRKCSLESAQLYPHAAFYIPAMLESISDQTLTTSVVDALSHSYDSLWNLHRTPQSQALAHSAIPRLISSLPRLLSDRDNTSLQLEVIFGVLQASLAFSQTKTSLAHAISYPLTLEHGVAHGVATSFSLPAILESVLSEASPRAVELFPASVSPETLQTFLSSVGIYQELSATLKTRPESSAIQHSLRADLRALNFPYSTEKALENVFSELL